MFVAGELGAEGVEHHRVGDLAHIEASLVQDGEDARVLLLHQVTDDLVVEVIHLHNIQMPCLLSDLTIYTHDYVLLTRICGGVML